MLTFNEMLTSAASASDSLRRQTSREKTYLDSGRYPPGTSSVLPSAPVPFVALYMPTVMLVKFAELNWVVLGKSDKFPEPV